jgi:hypothetical protein
MLPMPEPTVDQMCVDIKRSQGPMNLISDADQGERYLSQPPRESQTPLMPTHHLLKETHIASADTLCPDVTPNPTVTHRSLPGHPMHVCMACAHRGQSPEEETRDA